MMSHLIWSYIVCKFYHFHFLALLVVIKWKENHKTVSFRQKESFKVHNAFGSEKNSVF